MSLAHNRPSPHPHPFLNVLQYALPHQVPLHSISSPRRRPARSSYKETLTYRHNHACQTNIRTQPLANARGFPEGADEVVVLVAIDDAGEDVVRVRGGADCEENYKQEGLEVEERCLGDVSLMFSCMGCCGDVYHFGGLVRLEADSGFVRSYSSARIWYWCL
jgi:hypothetical protein